MITYIKGNIFFSPAEVLVNPVNIFGVMGKGLAADFKKKYPNMFKKYKNSCDEKQFDIGKLLLVNESDYRILLFPTKKHWRNHSKIEYIESGLKKFIDTYEKKKITSIAFPRLGCGFGNLSWKDEVRPLMEKYLRNLPIEVYIYINDEKISKNYDIAIDYGVDFSVDGLLSAIIKFKEKNNFRVTVENDNYNVNVDSQILWFENGVDKKNIIKVNKKEFESILKMIKNQNIFQAKDEDLKTLLAISVLKRFGYISEILILKQDFEDDDLKNFVKGFQLNRGAIRIFEKNQNRISQLQLF